MNRLRSSKISFKMPLDCRQGTDRPLSPVVDISVQMSMSMCEYVEHMVGGVVQWLGCQSLAGRLSLIYARSMVDMSPLRG